MLLLLLLLLPVLAVLLLFLMLLKTMDRPDPPAGAADAAIAAASPRWPSAGGGTRTPMFRVTSGQRRRMRVAFLSSSTHKPTLARHRTCCPARSTHCVGLGGEGNV